VIAQPFDKSANNSHGRITCSLNSSKEKRIAQSTFLSKGCLPIPQLFGARNLFSIGEPLQKEIRRQTTTAPDCQRKQVEMNLQLNF
jgi:hypothetical protein